MDTHLDENVHLVTHLLSPGRILQTDYLINDYVIHHLFPKLNQDKRNQRDNRQKATLRDPVLTPSPFKIYLFAKHWVYIVITAKEIMQ